MSEISTDVLRVWVRHWLEATGNADIHSTVTPLAHKDGWYVNLRLGAVWWCGTIERESGVTTALLHSAATLTAGVEQLRKYVAARIAGAAAGIAGAKYDSITVNDRRTLVAATNMAAPVTTLAPPPAPESPDRFSLLELDGGMGDRVMAPDDRPLDGDARERPIELE